MVEEPSHEIQRSLNHLRNKGLILNKTMFVVNHASTSSMCGSSQEIFELEQNLLICTEMKFVL
jgi:hypothetical protein